VTQIQQNRYDALMRRVGDLKGPGSKVNDVLEELFPVIDVERVPGELLALMGTRIAAAGSTIAGVADVQQRIQLFNPVGSGKLIAITHAYVSTTTAQELSFGNVTTTLTTATGVERFRDSRFGVVDKPSGQIRRGTNAAVAPDVWRVRVVSGFLLT